MSDELKPVICIGWPTIRKLAAGQEVDVGSAVLIAADGLYGEPAPSPVVAEVVKRLRVEANALDCSEPASLRLDAARRFMLMMADTLERGE